MKKLFLALLLMPLLSAKAYAQFNYNFSYQLNQPYVPLPANAPTANGTVPWDDDDFNTLLPFNFQWNKTVTSNIVGMAMAVPGICSDSLDYTSTSSIIDLFTAGVADLADRTMDRINAASPLRYQITGTAPNRIFKFEVRNAGFFHDNDSTDSVNYQYWLYETSHIIEVRYGPSAVDLGKSYFQFGLGPSVIYASGYDMIQDTGSRFYYLTGPANAPVLDSATDFMSIGSLDDYPASGTLYRLTPKPSVPGAVATTLAAGACQVYPTEAENKFMIQNALGTAVAYTVTALSGQVLLTGNAQPGLQQVDISALATGMYLVRVQNAEGTATFRLLKK